MRSRWFVGVVTMLLTLVADSVREATATEPNRLEAFAARQDLCNAVCVARADGRIDRGERHTLLLDAKDLLKTGEYESFKRVLDRIAPPVPLAKHSAKAKRSATAAHREVSSVLPPPTEGLVLDEGQAAEAETEGEITTDEAQAETVEISAQGDSPLSERVAAMNGAR